MISKFAITPQQIPFLNRAGTIYSVDFRAISEHMEYKIPAMRKYENLTPWLTAEKLTTVNLKSRGLKYINENHFIVCNAMPDPRISIYKRLTTAKIPKSIKKLWVAIPHPDADDFAEKCGFAINYTYDSFLYRNDKFRQKKGLGTLTPPWQIINSNEELQKVLRNKPTGYLKRRVGAGGFTTFPTSNVKGDTNFKKLFSANKNQWYYETFVGGNPYSIQCVRVENGNIIIFGFSKQIIVEGKYFTGSEIKNINSLEKKIFDQLRKAIEKLKPIFQGYTGFFGIDFIITPQGKVEILEANMRLTAATIPTLIANKCGAEALYREDVIPTEIADTDIILTRDNNGTADTLSLLPKK